MERDASKKIEVFHNRCLWSMLGITKTLQRLGCISSVQVAKWFEMEESLEDTIAVTRLQWLGHMARMNDDRIPKRLHFDDCRLHFGWL